MADEILKKPVASPDASGKTGAGNSAEVPKAQATVPPVVTAADSSPSLFGGHRGGGKKRQDGLIAGTAAAKEADRKADAARKAAARALQKGKTLPAPLPSATASNQDTVAPAAGNPDPVLSAPIDPILPSGAAPMFVPWQQRLLKKPAELIAKIADRARIFWRTKQVKRLHLSPDGEKDLLSKMRYKEGVLDDWSSALSEAVTIELNKRRVGGAEQSHWLTLAISTGELVAAEIENSRAIEALVLEDRAKNPQPSADVKAA